MISKNILISDVGSKTPNLAAMKVSAWHKSQGDTVFLNEGCENPDKAYVSCIFTKDSEKAREIAAQYGDVEIGGYGVNSVTLPHHIEHILPDYGLYGMDASMGFTTRGCIRNCSFCIVPDNEGRIHDHAPISEFHHPDHKKVILLDNNILALDWKFREDMEYIKERGLKVNFHQGLDLRLVTEENAGILADCKYYDWKFQGRAMYFAFDSLNVEPDVRRGIQHLNQAGVKPRHIIVYMLVGFDTTFEQDLYRYNVLWEELGVYPFVMVYDNRKDIPIIRHFSRWVNKRVHKVCAWGEYDHGRSQEVIKAFNGD